VKASFVLRSQAGEAGFPKNTQFRRAAFTHRAPDVRLYLFANNHWQGQAVDMAGQFKMLMGV
jgi:hypothetical protein